MQHGKLRLIDEAAMSARLKPGTYSIPNETQKRLKFALRASWTGGLVLAFFVVVTLFMGFSGNWETEGLWSLYVLDAMTAVLCGWAIYWYQKHSNFSYTVRGVKVVFDGADYYVPKARYRRFIDEILNAFDNALPDVKDTSELLEGVTIHIQSERPVDPAGRTDKVVGLTFPFRRVSYVWGPYAIDHSGAGYELRLQICQVLFPGRSERDDLAWLKANDLL